MNRDDQKRLAAAAALELVAPGMTLGLGTGSTAALFVDLLGQKVRNGLDIVGVPTSEETRIRAAAAGIEIIEPDENTIIDLAVDGADEVDGSLNLIKGGGGALLREKIVANAATRLVIIADIEKRVAQLGAFPLPVEIDPALWSLTIRALRQTLRAHGVGNPALALRHSKTGGVLHTDGGHLIVDCHVQRIQDPASLAGEIGRIPGVVETGLFIGMAHIVLFGSPNGIIRLERRH